MWILKRDTACDITMSHVIARFPLMSRHLAVLMWQV
jgi:hypothetical protein